ncbi:MAG: glycosyltransferase [Ilumatobacteraceae bacterium]
MQRRRPRRLGRRLLELQLDALVQQAGAPDHEIVLSLNTPSPDARAALEEMLRRRDAERFRIVDSSDRRGAPHARNVGAATSTAPLLAFCDGDDIVEPDWLAQLCRGLDQYDAVGGFLDESKLATAQQRRWRPPGTPGRLPEFQGVPYIISANLGVRREAFEDVGGFDAELIRGEDIAISLDLISKGYTIGYVAQASVHYRHRGGLKDLVRQYVLYGRGMTQVLAHHGLPGADGVDKPSGLRALKPNKSPGQSMSIVTVIRRGSMLTGRIYEMLRMKYVARRA